MKDENALFILLRCNKKRSNHNPAATAGLLSTYVNNFPESKKQFWFQNSYLNDINHFVFFFA